MSPTVKQKVKTDKAEVSIIDTNIFYVKYERDVFLEFEDFMQVREIFDEWTKDEEYKVLVEFPEFTSTSKEARELAEEYPIDAVREAIVFSSLAQRIVVRFYLLFNRQNHPVKAFRNLEKAIAWLNEV